MTSSLLRLRFPHSPPPPHWTARLKEETNKRHQNLQIMSPLSLFPHKHQAVGLKNKHDFPINANLHPRISLTKHGAYTYTPSHNWWKSNSLGSVGWLSFGLGVLSRRWRTADLLFLVFSLNCLHLSLSFSLSLTFRLLVKASRTLLTGVVDDDKTMEMVLS